MTGSVVSRAGRSDGRAIAKTNRFELLSYVAHARAECPRRLGVLLVTGEQMRVRDQHRAAAARVGDDERVPIVGVTSERVNVLARQDSRAIEIAGMRVQRSAANLVRRCLHGAVINFQHSPGCRIHSLKQTFSDARLKEKCAAERIRSLRPVPWHRSYPVATPTR